MGSTASGSYFRIREKMEARDVDVDDGRTSSYRLTKIPTTCSFVRLRLLITYLPTKLKQDVSYDEVHEQFILQHATRAFPDEWKAVSIVSGLWQPLIPRRRTARKLSLWNSVSPFSPSQVVFFDARTRISAYSAYS